MSALMDDFMTCDEFAEQLADYLEGDASDRARAAVETHAAGCEPCALLLADLQALPAQAAALPAMEPSRDLWSGIAERIDARVLPLETSHAARVIPFMQRKWVRPAMAAAALVIVTAGVTHYMTRAYLVPASAAPRQATQVASLPGATVTTTGQASVPAEGNAEFESSSTEAPEGVTAPRGTAAKASARLVSAAPLMKDAEPVYDREIARLRTIVRERRSQLDPATVAVLEQSVKIIDSAIAQSRAALAKDPASGFLANQLNHSLEKKVELLRTAALLPART